MVRLTDARHQPFYAAAELFRSRVLKADDSLFRPGSAIWSKRNLDKLQALYVDNPDESSASFIDKLQRQLAEASAETKQLMAEAIFVYLLPTRSVGAEKKRSLIATVLEGVPTPSGVPQALEASLDSGIASTGTAFNTNRYYLIRFLLEFVSSWKQLEPSVRADGLRDPWEFKRILLSVATPKAQPQREALLHLIHPEVFEPIISSEMKRQIVKGFPHLTDPSTDDYDRQLQTIRGHLAEEHGDGVTFWEPKIERLWKADASPWGQFLTWAALFRSHPSFDATERDYKFEIAARMAEARKELAREGDWGPALRRAFTNKSNNLTSWQSHDQFLKWCDTRPSEAAMVLRDLWEGEGDSPVRVGRFARAMFAESPVRGGGTLASLASVLLMACGAEDHPPYRWGVFHGGCQLTEHPGPRPATDAEVMYRHALDFLDTLAREASSRGLELRDRLDAQSVLFSVVKGPLPDDANTREQKRLTAYRKGLPEVDDPEQSEAQVDETSAGTLVDLARELLLDDAYLARAERLLEDKGQLIFQGPPGTGKTYVARKLARHFAGGDDAVELVQFHPSFSYEDFVEGYRPSLSTDGRTGFVRREGPLKTMARRAANDPDRTFLLVIDEINRGNVAKVFGELYFLLEYRDAAIRLQYSDEKFRLPRNLWIIGTMNTADRSIALVDAALRRRFHFVPFFPDAPPVQGLLHRWLTRHHPELLWVADAVGLVNTELEDRNLAIGPSHFMRDQLDEEWLSLIWEHSVLPYLEEQLLDDPERLRDFELDRVRTRLAPPTDSTAQNP